jgi:photosystem II stability/assembly factor-like uncharacterized protein
LSTLAVSDFDLACCVAADDTIYAGTNDARVLRLNSDGKLGPLTGFDRVAGRDTWYAGAAVIEGRLVGPPLGIRSMAVTCDNATLLANVHVGGIPRSTDGGTTWRPTIDIDSDVHQVCAHPTRPELVIAAAAAGLCVSWDRGESWSIECEGLHAQYCSAVAFVGDAILVAASTDHFASRGAIYRRPVDRDGPMLPMDGGLPRWLDGIADTGHITANGSKAAVVDRGGNLYLSVDAGTAWSRVANGLPTASGLFLC